MSGRAVKGAAMVKLGKDGAWHGFPDKRRVNPNRRNRGHIRRIDRQEAVYLFLKARVSDDAARNWRDPECPPPTAAEWFWLWLGDGSLRKAAGIFTRHTGPFLDHVLPTLDERSLQDLTPSDIAWLLNGIPGEEGKDGALRVLSAALREARGRGWVEECSTDTVEIVATRPPQLVFDDNDPAFDLPPDPGIAVVRPSKLAGA